MGRYVFGICLITVVLTSHSLARQVNPDSTNIVVPSVKTDSTSADSSSLQPELPPSPGLTPEPGRGNNTSNIKDAVEFQSTDSLIVNFRDGRTATLYGDAKVSHEAGTLTSGKIDLDLETNVVEAQTSTPEDTLSMPLLTRDTEEIRSRRILFNYQTNKGKFEEARVDIAEGQLIGSKIKNVSETEVFIEDGIYSTCPPEYLYYYIKAKQMKVVDQEEIFFKNARLYILDIPYPVVFPFGYVPSGIQEKKSGLLTPSYVFNESSSEGLGLANLGWFQYFNDYVTGTFKADVYTSGSIYLNTVTQYRKSDLYNGSINLGYSRSRGLEATDPNFQTRINQSISIQHSQTISPYASLTGNITIRTEDFYTENSFDEDERAQTESSSKASYTYRQPDGIFNFSTDARVVQDFFNNETSITGPNMTFSTQTFSPFQAGSGNTPRWYESITFKYNNNFRSDFRYDPIDADSAEIGFFEALGSPSVYEEATGNDDYIRSGFRQTGSLTLGRLFNNQYLNSSASFNFNEYWYPTTIRRSYNSEEQTVETEKIYGFATARDFTTSMSFSTRIYGISNAKIGKLSGIRHTFTPNISFNFRPDFSDEQWGFYRTVQSDSVGNTQTYSIFEGGIVSGPGSGEARSISFGVSNIFETKIVDRDSTGEINERTLRFIDNLSLNSSYNFAADSLKLSNASTRLSSNAIKGLNLTANATFSFYERNENGVRVNDYLWENGRIAQMESFSINASTSFRGGRKGIEPYTPIYRRKYDPLNQGIFSTIDPGYGYEPIAPLNSPWSFSLNFTYRWNYRFNDSPNRSATINATNISFNLTPKWKFSTRIGYDFIQKELTPSQFNLDRNLECWDLSFQIKPFGENQYYFFTLRVNSAQIQSIFQKLPVLNNLERRSAETGASPN